MLLMIRSKDELFFIYSFLLSNQSYLVYTMGNDAGTVGAGLAPALHEGDRKGRPYTFRI